jgi:hypothetical protein
MVSRLSVTSWCELWWQKEMDPMIFITLIHAPVLTSLNGAPWIYMGFFAHPYLEILKVMSTEMQQASLLNWMSVGSISPFGRYQFTKLSCAAQYALWSLWMTVVLHGWKCSIFVAFFWWGYWHSCLLCKWHQKLFWTYLQCGTSFLNFYLTSSVLFCMFCYCLIWNMLLETFPLLGIEFWSLNVTVFTELS